MMKQKPPFLLLFLTLVSIAESLFAQPTRAEMPHKILMGVMGDSITAASLADVPIPYADSAPEQVKKWAKQGQNSRLIYENKWALSWASGRKIDSHYLKLKHWLKTHGEKRKLDVLNVANPGDTTYDMEGQARQILEAMDAGGYDSIKYLAILIGSNDACSSASPVGTPPEVMRDNLMRALAVLSQIQQDEPLRILLIGIPRIPDLGTAAFRNASTLFGLKCETVRNRILGFCDPLLLWNTPEEYDQKMQIIEDDNRLLRTLANEAGTLFPGLEIAYSDHLYNLEIPIQVLAADCFHPGKFAQEKIAEDTWLDQPWYSSSHTRGRWECPGVVIHQQGPLSAKVGDEIHYLIHVENNGSCDLQNTLMTDFIPRRTLLKSASPEPSPLSPVRDDPPPPPSPVEHIEWKNISLSPGNLATDYAVTVQVLTPAGRTLTNTVCLEHPQMGRICQALDTYIKP